MPPVQGSEVPVAGRNIPPWRPGPGPPQDPVDHLPVIVPPAPAARRPVRQQRLQPDPLRISQVMTIEHRPALPNPPAKIGETRPRTHRLLDRRVLTHRRLPAPSLPHPHPGPAAPIRIGHAHDLGGGHLWKDVPPTEVLRRPSLLLAVGVPPPTDQPARYWEWLITRPVAGDSALAEPV